MIVVIVVANLYAIIAVKYVVAFCIYNACNVATSIFMNCVVVIYTSTYNMNLAAILCKVWYADSCSSFCAILSIVLASCDSAITICVIIKFDSKFIWSSSLACGCVASAISSLCSHWSVVFCRIVADSDLATMWIKLESTCWSCRLARSVVDGPASAWVFDYGDCLRVATIICV